MEHVSASSFYFWQKKLGPQSSRRCARTEDRNTGAKDNRTGAGDHRTDVGNHRVRAEDRDVFRPVTVVPGRGGVVVRLPGGAQIEVGIEHLDAIRVVVTETVRIAQSQAAERNASPDNTVTRKASSENHVIRNVPTGHEVNRTVFSDNQVDRKASFDNQVVRQRGTIGQCDGTMRKRGDGVRTRDGVASC